jgi:hypothetical protein
MANYKPIITPADTKMEALVTEGKLLSDATTCQSLVSALQYLTITRPDIPYVVQQVCLHM